MAITFDYNYLLDTTIGEAGIPLSQLPSPRDTYERVRAAKLDLGFAKLPYQEDLSELLALAEDVKLEFKNFVVIGIGGSDLGARAVHRALNHQFYNFKHSPRLFFFGDTTDPVAIQEVLDVVDLAETAFVVISKSGNTVEQMSTFIYVRALLLERFGQEETQKHVIILTDAETGTLREIVREEGYRSLVVPGDVGGRFSVLSTVGLFPLAVAGVDIRQLLAGAAAMDKYDNDQPLEENAAALYAWLQIWNYRHAHPISVLMPYTYGLREFGFWYRQLWAESLGKKVDLDGREVYAGPTPIAAVGPTDQHSQAQLYMEGFNDKVITFITVKNPVVNMTLPEAYTDKEGVAYLKGHSFAEILAAEQASTAYALAKAGRPSCRIELERLDAYHLGQLLYFFELAVSYAGALLHVNTYDQPGVEIGKQYMYGILGRPGFEHMKLLETSQEYQLTV